MKTATLIALAIGVFSASAALATDCRIIEHPDHNEVVCDGTRADSRPVKTIKTSEKESRKVSEQRIKYEKLRDRIHRLQRDMSLYREYSTLNAYFNVKNVSGIVAEANHKDVAVNKRLTVTVSCDVTSVGSGEVSVVIEGKTFAGRVVSEIPLHGYVEAGQYARLSKSVDMTAQKFQNVRTWETKQAGITTKIAEKSVFDERENTRLISGLIAEADDLKRQLGDVQSGLETPSRSYSSSTMVETNQSYSSGVAGDVIVLPASMGKISFPHKSHQEMFDCTKCHVNVTGKIAGFGKDLAHKTCKGCHADMKRGPTSCKDCHKK